MRLFPILILVPTLILAGCAVGGRQAVVSGAGPELLKLRGGPGLGFRIIAGLPDGTRLTRHDCVTEVGQLWCRVTMAGAPGVEGYVAADYLVETR